MKCAVLNGWLAIVLVLAAPMLWAGDYEDAKHAYADGDRDQALNSFARLAAQGEPRAQFMLAGMYERGEGAPRDAAQALDWYHKSAELNYGPAQLRLAQAFDQRSQNKPDKAEARRWFGRAALQGMDAGLCRTRRCRGATATRPHVLPRARRDPQR